VRVFSALALAALLIATAALAQPAGDAGRGKALFEDRCTLCHGEAAEGQGPNLKGVAGRKAGSLAGFPYSQALTASGLTWSAASLDRFLADPVTAVPGTAMPLSVPDAGERADLIAYLATLTP
jgi:cytochrome c2